MAGCGVTNEGGLWAGGGACSRRWFNPGDGPGGAKVLTILGSNGRGQAGGFAGGEAVLGCVERLDAIRS